MTKEFNLSKLELKAKPNTSQVSVFLSKDVKEFIKRLKTEIIRREKLFLEDIAGNGLSSKEKSALHSELAEKLSDFIDKLAGDELK